jgi:hypothetical protein
VAVPGFLVLGEWNWGAVSLQLAAPRFISFLAFFVLAAWMMPQLITAIVTPS